MTDTTTTTTTETRKIDILDAEAYDTAHHREGSGRSTTLYLVPAEEASDGVPYVTTHESIGGSSWPMAAWHSRWFCLGTIPSRASGESVRDWLLAHADDLADLAGQYLGSEWDGSNYRGKWEEDAGEWISLAWERAAEGFGTYWDAVDWTAPAGIASWIDLCDHHREDPTTASADDLAEADEQDAASDGHLVSGLEDLYTEWRAEWLAELPIEDLREGAAEAGDLDMVGVCDAALGGDEVARLECARAISAAEAMDDDDDSASDDEVAS